MGRVFALLLMIVGIYVGITVYTEGTDRAFGGLFAGAGEDSSDTALGDDAEAWGEASAPAPVPITQRVRAKVQGEVDERYRRSAE